MPPQDTNYDLALIRWGCQTLIESAQLLGIDDELRPRWQEVLARLTPYPADGNGFMIGADTPYAQSHRNYSHPLMVYPLHLVTWDQPESRDLVTKPVARWYALTGAQRGHSYTGAASIYATTGDGERGACRRPRARRSAPTSPSAFPQAVLSPIRPRSRP
ncbi:hypothetical protein BFF78_02475 [Streptomyces fodineus]|uniref:Glycosyl hydrolase family 95 catalytic domain-containing protein n=1 Tax=Streptomyces fodineus TaxID=1904616 RepID=A0A1D7Y3F6_9ACTN|nr:hypothetical protein BFF78_02475 [Streptomyces fodineus]